MCSSATFAVWMSAGGLETRQFPFFIVLAVVGLTLYPERCLALLGVSLSLAAASLTRPGGTAVRRVLFRLVHGETTDCERALMRDGRAWRSLTHVLPFLYHGPPCQAWRGRLRISAAGCLLAAAGNAGSGVGRSPRRGVGRCGAVGASGRCDTRGGRLVVGCSSSSPPVLFYCGAIQATRLFLGKDDSTSLRQQHLLRPGRHLSAGCWLHRKMPALIALSDNLGTILYRKAWIRTSLRATRDWTNEQLAQWRPYQEMRREILPSDALAETGPAGILPSFVPDLQFIDFWGLTDTTIARNPETRRRWRFGHAGQPPPGYLRARGGEFRGVPGGCQRGGSGGPGALPCKSALPCGCPSTGAAGNGSPPGSHSSKTRWRMLGCC